MIVDIPAVVREGSAPIGTVVPLVPTAFPLTWPRGEDGTLRLKVQRQDLSAFDLTGAAVVFGLRRWDNDAVPAISREATIIDAGSGRADVDLVSADTLSLVTVDFTFDVQLTDPAGKRWQIVPRSTFRIDPIFAQPSDGITVLPAAAPLALGPSWLELGYTPEASTDTTTAEQVPNWLEILWNFDDGTAGLANIFVRLTALAKVSGGIGTIRARYGGTPGQPDGTVLLMCDAVVGTSYAAVGKTATVVKPTGTQLVKITLQNDTAGQTTFLRGLFLRARGAI